MPSALSVPICEPTSRSGACIMRTSADRNAKHHWMEESARRERQKAARCERGANTQRVCVANFVLRDHSANFLHAKFATIENRFSFVSRRELSTELNWTRQKKVASLIRE